MRISRIAALLAGVLLPTLFYRGVMDLQWHTRATPSTMSFGNAQVHRFSGQRAVAQYSKRWQYGAAAAAAANATDDGAAPIRIRSKVALLSKASEPTPLKPATPQTWIEPKNTALVFNEAGRKVFENLPPHGATIHFTFGSAVMMDFVQNWLHFVGKAGLTPYLVGSADSGLFKFCTAEGVPSAAISPELDVWTYERKARSKEVYEIETQWKYFRHHDSDFLEMGLVKVAFLWELLSAGFSVLISDLDVVWLNGHWQRWMTWADAAAPPVREASLIALADVLVTTDELDHAADAKGRRPSTGQDLNTGVVHFRAGPGALAMVQQWRKAMLARKGDKNLNENVNDQSLFNQVVRGNELEGARLAQWLAASNAPAAARAAAEEAGVRRLYQSAQPLPPCLPGASCTPSHFTFGTLPMRPFTGGHTWFNQNVQEMPGHEEPRYEPITVHFTFQFGDTGAYPHGKRQRAREAALWAVDPPEYFTEGVFVALSGPAYSAEEQAAVYRRFPEWSPQRHMFMDAPQRQAVRDLLGLATAVGGIMVMPKLWCHCDRYWGFLKNCRFPFVPNMPLPFNCPQDALYDPTRWHAKKVKYREHTFLSNPNVPASLVENTLALTVAEPGATPTPSTSKNALELPYGTPLSEVRAAVLKQNPAVRVIKVSNAHLRRLCRWLGSAADNRAFNQLIKYILTESSRYCPDEDHNRYGGQGGGWDWQNPFTAYNCTWGFHHPALFPSEDVCHQVHPTERVSERGNSTTCPRQMLCDWNTLEDGRETKPITWCNIEGYNGMKPSFLGAARAMMAKMPDGRCPYPPGDVPGPGAGFDARGHYVGTSS